MTNRPGHQDSAAALPLPVSCGSPKVKESVFQLKLAEVIQAEGHKVALRDAGTKAWPRRFSSTGLCPDLLVETSQSWPLHEAIPSLAIETKVGFQDSVSDILDGVLQLIELKKHESQIIYRVDEKEVRPVLYLFTNPCLLDVNVATFWHTNKPRDDSNCCARYMTRVFSTLLSRFSGGLLVKDLCFQFEGHVNGYQMSRTVGLKRSHKNYPANKSSSQSLTTDR